MDAEYTHNRLQIQHWMEVNIKYTTEKNTFLLLLLKRKESKQNIKRKRAFPYHSCKKISHKGENEGKQTLTHVI